MGEHEKRLEGLGIPPSQRKRVADRRAILREWQRLVREGVPRMVAVRGLVELARSRGEKLSQATLYGWLEKCRCAGVHGLIDGRSGPRRKQVPGSAAVVFFKRRLACQNGRGVAEAWRRTAAKASKYPGDAAWAWPSCGTVRRWLKKHQKHATEASEEGELLRVASQMPAALLRQIGGWLFALAAVMDEYGPDAGNHDGSKQRCKPTRGRLGRPKGRSSRCGACKAVNAS